MALTEDTRLRIVELFDAGETRNDIARMVGVSSSTVTTVCRKAGRSFDRAAQLLDLRADETDLTELRQRVTTKMLLVAEDALDNLDGPHLVYNFGGKDNTYIEHLLDEAPLETRLDAMRAASLAVDKAARLIERSNPDLEVAEGILDSSAAMFEAVAHRLRSREVQGDDSGAVEA